MDKKTMNRKRMLVFVPGFNTPGKKDVTGAFEPEARRYMKTVCDLKSSIVTLDNRRPFDKLASGVLDAISMADDGPYDGVAFFCHGWKSGIQLGFNNRNVEQLARAVYALFQHSFPVIALYCCSTGGDVKSSKTSPGTGDNSFADLLRDALCREISADGDAPFCRVMAHETVAHTTKNPRVRFFDGFGSPDGGMGGYRPVKLNGELWKTWVKELRSDESELRFRMPHMEVSEISEWLKDAE